MSEAIYSNLIKYLESKGVVCPMPQKWNELYEMLPNKKRRDVGWEPSLPLILSAWDSPMLFKKLRFLEHLEYAYKNDVINEIDKYLRALNDEDWLK